MSLTLGIVPIRNRKRGVLLKMAMITHVSDDCCFTWIKVQRNSTFLQLLLDVCAGI
jgi:hypothetical protein